MDNLVKDDFGFLLEHLQVVVGVYLLRVGDLDFVADL